MGVDSLDYFIGTSLARESGEFTGHSDFSGEQLSGLKSLDISTMTEIRGISKLKNLENLNILCMDSTEYSSDKVIDYSEISNLDSLKSLIIVNNLHVEKLDVSNLESLERIILVANYNLKEIIGIEKLTKLNRVVIVGNDIKSFRNIQTYISNTKNTQINILDYKIFNSIYKDYDSYKYLLKMSMGYDTNLCFAEKIGIGEIFIYSFSMIDEVNIKAEIILGSIINNNMTTEEKVLAVYKYVVSHLTYDYEALEERAQAILSGSQKIHTYYNRYKQINSSYQAFTKGKVVCEGYANMFNFLLNKLGIESHTVYSNVKGVNDYKEGLFNHAANIAKIEDEYYYFDTQLEKSIDRLEFFKKTREEFEQTHNISLSTQFDQKGKKR